MKKIIVGEQLVKSYGEGAEKRNVLDGVSVTVHEGEFVSVMGPSGSGKSTLMFVFSGMDTIESGKVTVDGQDLSTLTDNDLADMRRRKMGFIFQQSTFMKNLNILDNIVLPALRDHRRNARQITERARTLMAQVGISGLEQRDITQVSGGQLQRAGVCRALMSNPKILIGDEPTGALNSKSAHEIMNIFGEVNKTGTAVMIVTHDATVAARAERIMFMRDGRIESEMRLPKFQGKDNDDRINEVRARMRELGI